MTGNEEKLAARVLRELDEAGLGAYGLKARCSGSLLTLQGIVDVLAEKIRAEEIAGRIPGIGRVENAITVCTDGSVDDEDVAMEVAEELAADPARTGVGAEVSGGCVKLVGQVPTAAAAASAIAAAAKARGVREVASELSLAPEAATDDPSLVNAIETTLGETLGVEARHIQAVARHGVVRLTGNGRPRSGGQGHEGGRGRTGRTTRGRPSTSPARTARSGNRRYHGAPCRQSLSQRSTAEFRRA